MQGRVFACLPAYAALLSVSCSWAVCRMKCADVERRACPAGSSTGTSCSSLTGALRPCVLASMHAMCEFWSMCCLFLLKP